MDEKIQALEQRITELETMLNTHILMMKRETVLVAPVRIVTPEGRLLISINYSDDGLGVNLFNSHGSLSAVMGSDATQAGFLALYNAEGKLVVSCNVETSGARLILSDHDRDGGIALFGGDSDPGKSSGGGINILRTGKHVGMSLWSKLDGAEITFYNEHDEQTFTLSSSPSAK
jgi:hypothetical protein